MINTNNLKKYSLPHYHHQFTINPISTKNQYYYVKKCKLTDKIQQLSSPIYERTLSPWTRKRGESIDRKIFSFQDSCQPIGGILESSIESLNQNSNIMVSSAKMNQFLRKIQFTKRKSTANQSILNQERKTRQLQIDSKQSKELDLLDLTSEEIKKFIMYPPKTTKKQFKIQNLLKRSRSREFSVKKIVTIQNFFDSVKNYPLKSQDSQKLSLVQDGFKHNSTTKLTDLPQIKIQLNSTFYKNSLQQTSERLKIYPVGQRMNQIHLYSNSNLKQTQNKFFKSNRKQSKKFITQAFCHTSSKYQNPQHKYLKQNHNIQSLESKSFKPTEQAIRRIKQQYKKSHRIKTEAKNYNLDIQHCQKKHGQKQFLYKTFLNYKTQKTSNDLNITKTLKFNFHNKSSFQKNFERSLKKQQKKNS